MTSDFLRNSPCVCLYKILYNVVDRLFTFPLELLLFFFFQRANQKHHKTPKYQTNSHQENVDVQYAKKSSHTPFN